MSRLNHRFSRSISLQSLTVLGIGLITLALWMLPAMAGSGSSYDPLICVAWAIILICLLMLNYHRVLQAETRDRTVYLDITNHHLYSKKLGIAPYRNGCQLTEIMGSCFAKNTPATHPETPDSNEFQLSAIIRTTSFDFQMSTPDPTFAFKNMTVHEWTGVIELAESDRTFTFESLSELEDLLCPLMCVDAVSIVGRCPDAHTDACLCNERLVRSTQGDKS